ncbi:capping protein-inhibiting regulator of actin dynamics isoform X2 [Talpa occidentalis]|nr:capping protein-inhibiting regulator of actin dynamics isoform X2 [Talpa occidentalis]
MKKADSGEVSLEEDLLPPSPMEIVTQQDIVLSDTENKSSDTPSSLSPPNLPGATSEMEEKVAPAKPSRPKRHFSSAGTIESVNLDAIPLAIARLDNSAAKHKLSVKPKNQRVSKRHRRLIGDRPDEDGGLLPQLSPGQNGHSGEDKASWHEEEPEPLDSEEERRRQDEYWRELEAKCKRQKAEAAEKRRLEEQRQQALERRLWEENRRQELLEEQGEEEAMEEKQHQPAADKRQHGEEKQRPEEPSCQRQEQREPEEGELLEAKQKPLKEEAERQERPREQEELEAWSRWEAEQLRQEEERESEALRRREEPEEQRREERRLDELRQREELEELGRREEEERRMKELRKQEEETKRREELRKQEEMETQGRQDAEKEHQDVAAHKDERQLEPDSKRGPRSPLQKDLAEKPEDQHLTSEKQRQDSVEPSLGEKQHPEAEPLGEQQGAQGALHEDDGCERRGKREAATVQPSQKQEAQVEVMATPVETKEAAAPETDRKGEELRWQEVDERQTMPRPYTFQVASGGKQILFPKVNLSPVTPVKDAGLASAPHEPKAPKASPAPHALSSSLSIPHTAILVTGAQLCSPAVNLSQIKDTACKSLLGLSEEKKQVDVPTPENPPRVPADPRPGSGKARPPQESPSSAAALAEWASIRSRILKNAESDQRGERDQTQPSDEHPPRGRSDSRGNLRKTPPVNAKFSIMPAWQKFSDGGTETSRQNLEAENLRKRPGLGPSEEAAPQLLSAGANVHQKGPEKVGVHQEPTDTTEGCKFAKDLPSFLVPSLPYPSQKAGAHAEPATTSDSETPGEKPDPMMPGAEEKASPFGIKLRRTNYSLRFHCDQQTEQKKKKRHSSTGDSADGGPPTPRSTNAEKETEGTAPKHGPSHLPERKLTPASGKDSAESPSSHSPAAVQPGPAPAHSQTLAPEPEKVASKTPLAQKPALAPKPTSQTPPPSPVSKLSRPYLVELLARRAGRPSPEPSEPCKEDQRGGDPQPPSPPLPEERQAPKRDEEEVETERKPSAPALSAARQEKPSQAPEAARKEKPVLQSRHSLDGSKLGEKVETAQPLWITLALQKQKGFREQQATREERKQAREAKQAEKFSKENVGVSRAGSLHKSTAQPEEKKPETAVARLERREQLKKANTLPTSVTVEISDSGSPAPLVKEVTKRLSTPDAAPVSTEPAWLALAKRKAKAWSDCPQIIK